MRPSARGRTARGAVITGALTTAGAVAVIACGEDTTLTPAQPGPAGRPAPASAAAG